jgi:hypothetical protein
VISMTPFYMSFHLILLKLLKINYHHLQPNKKWKPPIVSSIIIFFGFSFIHALRKKGGTTKQAVANLALATIYVNNALLKSFLNFRYIDVGAVDCCPLKQTEACLCSPSCLCLVCSGNQFCGRDAGKVQTGLYFTLSSLHNRIYSD